MTPQELLKVYKAAYKEAGDTETSFSPSGITTTLYPPYFSHGQGVENTSDYFNNQRARKENIKSLGEHLNNGLELRPAIPVGAGSYGRATPTMSREEMEYEKQRNELGFQKDAEARRNYLSGLRRSYALTGMTPPPLGGAKPVPFGYKMRAFFSKNPTSVIDSWQSLADEYKNDK